MRSGCEGMLSAYAAASPTALAAMIAFLIVPPLCRHPAVSRNRTGPGGHGQSLRHPEERDTMSLWRTHNAAARAPGGPREALVPWPGISPTESRRGG